MYLESLLLSAASEEKLVKICVLTMNNIAEDTLVFYTYITYILATFQEFFFYIFKDLIYLGKAIFKMIM